MNPELINGWEKIVGHDRMKIISSKFFDSRLDLEFPDLQKGSYEYKKLSITSELENNANMLIEFEREGFLTHDEVSRMIEVSTQNIISNNMPGALFETISIIMDDEILKNIKNKLTEIEIKGFLTHDEVTGIVKVLARNITDKSLSGALFKYICIMLDDEEFKDQEEERLEMLVKYIRWCLDSLNMNEKQLE
ncbi:MAG: hypothetical protein FIB07_14600 [Candidatus Methanoperedens sp.]|nr:hypothetical protein [Candidatus Methanoperedens sp.]